MTIKDLTKEFIENCGEDELVFWFNNIKRHEECKRIRQELINYLDIRDADGDAKIIKVGHKHD